MRKELWGQRDVPYGGTGPGEDSGSGGGGDMTPYPPGDPGSGQTEMPPPPPAAPTATAQLGEAQPRDFGNGFTNLQAYLYANPGGGGANAAQPTAGYSQGMGAYDSAIAGAYGLTPPPVAAPAMPIDPAAVGGMVGSAVGGHPRSQNPVTTEFGAAQPAGYNQLRRYLAY